MGEPGGNAFDDYTLAQNPPMHVVTVEADGERGGCLIGFATQASIDPPRFLVCISVANRTYRLVQRADVVAVHALGREQRALAELFGGTTGDEVDKLARCAWHPGPDGVPVLDDCPLWFAGRVLERLPFGDHVGLLLAPVDHETAGGVEPAGFPALHFRDVRDLEPGHPA